MKRSAHAARLLCGLVLCLIARCETAQAQSLSADLSSRFVAITTGFTGTSIVLFGATDGAGDIIVVVRGPEHDTVVRRKSKVASIWVNTAQSVFLAAPSFYSVASTKPVEDILPPGLRQFNQIGIDNLRLNAADAAPQDELTAFRNAFIRNQERAGLYSKQAGPVSFLGDRLFRTTIDFPADVPIGTYLVEVLLIRDQDVAAAQTIPLEISEVGIDADVYEFADRNGLLYGLTAVGLAVIAGWLASLPFREA
jgi:uncharacterized protein (TIGR02186 family)